MYNNINYNQLQFVKWVVISSNPPAGFTISDPNSGLNNVLTVPKDSYLTALACYKLNYFEAPVNNGNWHGSTEK